MALQRHPSTSKHFVEYNHNGVKSFLKKHSKAQYFYSFKASYDASYEASQMFCFDYTVL